MELVDFRSGASAEGFWDQGKGELRLYLEDGEVLSGKYVKMNNARFTIGAGLGGSRHFSGVRVYPSVGINGKGNFYALLHSEKSSLVVEVVADYNLWSRKGYGEARSNDGRVYKVVF